MPSFGIDVITLAKIAYALVNEIGFGLQRHFQLESRRKTFARVALIAQVAILSGCIGDVRIL